MSQRSHPIETQFQRVSLRNISFVISLLSAMFFSQKLAAQEVNFDIPEGLASTTLMLYAEQAGRQVLFPFDQMREKVTNTVLGKYEVDEALSILLKGTDLVVASDEDENGTLTISFRQINDERSDMKKRKRRSFWNGLTAIATAIVSGNAIAQDAAVGDNSLVLEEIIVTATKREQSLQEVPVSITVFNAAQLENNRIESVQDIARLTPGFTGSSFSNSNPIFAIRGANNTFAQAGASKPVGVFVDEVFIPRNSAANFDLFDLDQVSVLRGPQGTLFGRNVTGGAVQITTAKPSLEESQFKVKVGAGNLGFTEAAVLGNQVFSDSAAGKLSVSYKQRDGYITDRFNGQEQNDIETLSVRGQLLFAVSESTDLTFSFDYTEDDNNSRGLSFVSDFAGVDFTGNDGNIRTAETDLIQNFDRDIFGASLHINHDRDAGTFSSITAYRTSEADEVFSIGAGAVALSSVSTQLVQSEVDSPSTFSQEFRFVSTEGKVFDYIAGLYYYDESTDRDVNGILFGAAGNARFFDRTFNVNVDTQSVAAYLDGTFHLGDSIDLSLGVRYTDEDKDARVNFFDNGRPANSFQVAPGDSFSETTTRVALTWNVNDNLNLFASRTEGFTAGGFNTETNSIQGIVGGFEPETITSYEIGSKSVLLNGALTLNLTAFSQDFENKQEGFFNPEARIFSIFNASEASIDGLELETIWKPSERLLFSANYSDLDATYDTFVIPGGANFSGNQLQTAPDNSFSLSVNYEYELAGDGNVLVFNASYIDQDDYFTGASNQPSFLISGFDLINASLSLVDDDDRWKVSLWVKNLGDEEYVLVRAANATSGVAELFGEPRTYGVTASYSF